MSHLKWDDERPNVLWWTPSNKPGEWNWEIYHAHLDEIEVIIQERNEPFYVIFKPGADLPQGSPIQHMKRVVDVTRNYDKLMLMPIILPPQMPLAVTFANVLNRLIGIDQYTPIVRSDAEALQKIVQSQSV